jgi:adenylate cyclase
MVIATLFGLAIYSIIITALLLRKSVVTNTALQHSSPISIQQSEQQPTQDQLAAALKQQTRFQEKADEALRLTQTFQKFVPRQFVEHFAKHGESSLELGRADEDDVAILFCDIRGFTGLSEQMKPQELMKFLNSYFLRMNDPIHQNGGFIDKFIGDAIMALFDHPGGKPAEKAGDALNAALDLHRALAMYNQHRANSGYSAIKIGIGIHYGAVIIGTVGSDDRMDTTVIGDSVNIASRLEALTSKYAADIIISEQLLATAEHYDVKARMLDWVKVKGRRAPLKIFEVLSHLPIDVQTRKMTSSRLINQSIEARIEQRWTDALDYLQQALIQVPEDPLIIHHIEVCHRYRALELPADWDGALAH